MPKKGVTYLELIDQDDMVQNIPKPYIFVTLKQFKDKPLFRTDNQDFQFQESAPVGSRLAQERKTNYNESTINLK
jgi:hypothetical protein